jgi:integrase
VKGSTIKRCSCPVEYDAKGNRKACGKRHGSWSYIIDVGKDHATGKRKQLRKSGFRTQAEAEQALTEVVAEVNQGRYRHDGRQTVRSYLEQWIDHKSRQLRPTTMEQYRRAIRRAVPNIGHLRLRDLQSGHLSALYRDLSAGGVATTSVAVLHACLRSALADARREGLIKYNPAADATAPRPMKKKVQPWSGAELGAFLDHTAGHPLGALFELMALAGLRRGEALGLRWQDVNLSDGFLVVRQQLVAVTEPDHRPCPYCGQIHRSLVFGPPKTSSGDARRVDLGQAAIGSLLTHKLSQDAQRAQWGDAYSDHGLVFAREDGGPVQPDHATKAFAELAAEAGLRHVRLHDLRHGRASLLLAAGVDIAVVSKVLGHSTIALTADTYSHLLAGVGRAAADAADALVLRQPRDQSVTKPAPGTPQALPADTGKEPVTCGDARADRGTRTPNPLITS